MPATSKKLLIKYATSISFLPMKLSYHPVKQLSMHEKHVFQLQTVSDFVLCCSSCWQYPTLCLTVPIAGSIPSCALLFRLPAASSLVLCCSNCWQHPASCFIILIACRFLIIAIYCTSRFPASSLHPPIQKLHRSAPLLS